MQGVGLVTRAQGHRTWSAWIGYVLLGEQRVTGRAMATATLMTIKNDTARMTQPWARSSPFNGVARRF